MSRLLLVSNRLPVTLTIEGGQLVATPSSGGLATGLRGPHDQLGGIWFGWPGDLPETNREVQSQLRQTLAPLRLVPVLQSKAEIKRYYHGLSNGILWPLCHYLLDRIPLHSRDWEAYRRVNERFASIVAEHYRPGDLIWVHDFHLLLVPALLRRKLPDATIGLFLHVPFPSYEVFRLLPWRDELLSGMLGADLIGFHTPPYLRHFSSAILQILGLEVEVNRVWVDGREVELGAYPMGIDAAAFSRLADEPEVLREARALRMERAGEQIVLGIDRLDYTKGIPRRLLAFERLLERAPDLRGKVRLIQIAVPSRLQVGAYKAFRRRVDELVGRINSKHATFGSVPIHYLLQSFTPEKVTAMYRAADVMLVTPLRDGMNLVAKEYVASRNDEDGVLVLSEFAGASSQLSESISVNPYDIDGVASAIHRALTMSREEQRTRMRMLRESVAREDVHHWAASFIDGLERIRVERATSERVPRWSSRDNIEEAVARLRNAPAVALFLDYDGTLRPFVAVPDLAVPDDDLLDLMRSLAARRGMSVHLVTGRRREQVDEWFGALPIGLHAEHGLWSRWSPEDAWTVLKNVDTAWKETVAPILHEFARRTPGAMVEEKDVTLVWHYRRADRLFGSLQAKDLRLHLLEMLSNLPVRVLAGEKTVEVRAYDIHKGAVVGEALRRIPGRPLAAGLGDDRTDEDLFAALPADGIAVHVGTGQSTASIRLRSTDDGRDFLRRILR